MDGFGRPLRSSQSTCSRGVCRLTLCKDSPAFPGALSDPWTCPGPWPPLFAVIRAMKRICCSWGWGPRQALPSTSTSRGRGGFSQPDPAKRVWEIQDHLQDSAWLPLPGDPYSAPTIPPVPPPRGTRNGSYSVPILYAYVPYACHSIRGPSSQERPQRSFERQLF